MSALLDSLAAGFDGDAARRALLDDALRDGLPGPRAEAWKYTSLRQLERRSFASVASAPEVGLDAVAGIPSPRVVFVNGNFSPALSRTHELPDGVSLRLLSEALDGGDDSARFPQHDFARSDDVFARLNAALAREGVLLHVDAGIQVERPLHLVFIGAADDTDRAWHLRNRVDVGDGASLAIVEHHFAATPHAHLANSLTHVLVAAGARLSHARVQSDADRATQLLRTEAVLAGDADYRRADLELGAALSRHELNVRLQGDNARLVANGVLLADGRRHVDTRLGIDHVARDTGCELTWRGVGGGRGRVVFHGGITIHEGADGTDARLANKNLLLSDNAEIDTQPVLVIHADEVQAAHGATVGQLDAQALFYLRSRGLGATEARKLLTAAFCREPLTVIENADTRDALVDRVDAALAALAGPED